MSVTPEEREKLHKDLDEIIHMRNLFEDGLSSDKSVVDFYAERNIYQVSIEPAKMAHTLIKWSIQFAGNLSGNKAIDVSSFPYPKDNTEKRRTSLANSLFQLSGFFRRIGPWSFEEGFRLDRLADALLALNAGEVSNLLLPTRTSGLRKNTFTRARHQLLALCWEKYLIATGTEPKKARWEVERAYDETWDTIRKWKKQCERAMPIRAEVELGRAEEAPEQFSPEYILGVPIVVARLTLEKCGQLYCNLNSDAEKT